MFYPQNIKCAVCGKDMFEENRYEICSGCSLKANIRFCPKCGRAVGETTIYCDDCMNHGRNFLQARAPFIYEGKARNLVHRLKYGGERYLAKVMAQYLADEYYKNNWCVDIVTYVPMHPKKERTREYNQAYWIAKELSQIIKIPLVTTLTRIKYSENFAKLSRSDRFKEAENSFVANDNFKKKKILLVDDVFTTGATTESCSKELKKKGALEIYVLTFCTGMCKPELY